MHMHSTTMHMHMHMHMHMALQSTRSDVGTPLTQSATGSCRLPDCRLCMRTRLQGRHAWHGPREFADRTICDCVRARSAHSAGLPLSCDAC